MITSSLSTPRDMAREHSLCRVQGRLLLGSIILDSTVICTDTLISAGAEVTAMGVLGDLIKVLQRLK